MDARVWKAAVWIAACGLWVADVQNAMGDPSNTGNAAKASGAESTPPPVQEAQAAASGFYALSTRTLEGEPADLSQFQGQVALVVNVASRCGLTPQYEGLEALHKELLGRGFTVLGFPSNDFRGQEPGSAEEIREFCSTTYGITFPIFEKMVVTGEAKSGVYQFLTEGQDEPNWNFTKYLVAKDGTVLERFDPGTTPDDGDLRKKIEAALAR